MIRLRTQKIKRLVSIFVISLFAAGVVLLFWKSSVFKVRTVVCTVQNGGDCPDGVKEEVERLKGSPMMFTATKQVEEKIQRAVSSIQEIHIQKKLPNTLHVIVALRQPSFLVQQEGSLEFFEVDTSGKLYRMIQDPEKNIVVLLPTDSPWNVGSVIPKETTEVLVLFVHSLQSFSQLVSSLRYNSTDEIILSFVDGRKAIVKSGNAQQQLDTLQHILNDATMDTQHRTIDVRFAHPVIR